MSKEEVEKRQKCRKEYQDFGIWTDFIVSKDKTDFLLFSINKSLERIADSLEREERREK